MGLSGLVAQDGERVENIAGRGRATVFDQKLFVVSTAGQVHRVPVKADEDLLADVTSDELAFVIDRVDSQDRVAIPLYSPRSYEPGRSVYHLDVDRHSDPENQLMLPDLPVELAVRHPGPAVLRMLQAMGYQLGEWIDLCVIFLLTRTHSS